MAGMTDPRVSVFTASHEPTWLDDCHASLLRQTRTDWEWVVVLNQGARWVPPGEPDDRVRVLVLDQLNGVGACKSYATEQCVGEILVELDHDDLLAPTCLERVVDAFDANPRAAVVYSSFAIVDADLRSLPPQFGGWAGWATSEQTVQVLGRSRRLTVTHAMDASYPHNASLVWFAPNHARAFRRSAYEAAGGYDYRRRVCDDLDLLTRLYQQGPFVMVDEPLYLQRSHPAQTQLRPDLNAEIQDETWRLYDERLEDLALTWAARNGLAALDLGAAHAPHPGYAGVDLRPGPGVAYVGDVLEVLAELEDESVGVVRAVDFLEHVADRVALWNELWRVLAHGGLVLSDTPSTDGRGAWQDPTHVAGYNENAFWYFTDPAMQAYVPELVCRFQAARVVTRHPSEWHREHDVSYVQANLVAVHDGPRQGGENKWELVFDSKVTIRSEPVLE